VHLRERPLDALGQLAVVLLALFAQMERTHPTEGAAHAWAVAAAHSLYRYLPPRRPVAVMAAHRAEGVTVAPAGTDTSAAGAAVVAAS